MKHDDLHNLLHPAIAALNLELLGIEFAPNRGNSLVRVYIDAPGRLVAIEDCEAVSREISALLDVNDPVSGRYTLEVSSPGIDRPLFTAAQFGRFIGSEAKLQVNVPIAGRRRFQGPIVSVVGETITLQQDGQPVDIAHGNVLRAHLVPDLAALGLVVEKPGKKASSAKKVPSGNKES